MGLSHTAGTANPTGMQHIPLFDLAAAKIGLWISTIPNARDWLLEKVFPKAVAGLFIALGGSGKSQLMLQIAIAIVLGIGVAVGRMGAAWHAPKRGAVLYLAAEDDPEELHRRLYHTVATMNLTEEQKNILNENLFIKSMVSENNFMTMTNPSSREIVPTDYGARLLKVCEGIPNLRLIIIDPASRFRGGDEISNDDATRFVIEIEKLAKATGASVLCVHHAGKAAARENEPHQNAARGASALVDGVRWVCNLTVMSETEARNFGISAGERKQYMQLMATKNNYAPPQLTPIWLRRCEHGYLEYVALTSMKGEEQKFIKRKIIETVATDTGKGVEWSKTGFSNEYAGTHGRFKCGDQKLRGLLQELIDEGQLVERIPAVKMKNVSMVLAVPVGA